MTWIAMDSSVEVISCQPQLTIILRKGLLYAVLIIKMAQVSVILKCLFATKLHFFSFSWRELRFKTLNKPAKNQNLISGYE